MSEFVAASAKVHRGTVLVFALVLGQAVGMGGCSSTLSEMPTQLGGLPAGTPERPATPSAYPAVHDMPPPRPNSVLSEDERKKAEAELTALRTRQEKQAGTIGTTGSVQKDQQSPQ